MGAVARILVDSVMGWYRRRPDKGVAEARGGAVTVIQRCSSDMSSRRKRHSVFTESHLQMSDRRTLRQLQIPRRSVSLELSPISRLVRAPGAPVGVSPVAVEPATRRPRVPPGLCLPPRSLPRFRRFRCPHCLFI